MMHKGSVCLSSLAILLTQNCSYVTRNNEDIKESCRRTIQIEFEEASVERMVIEEGFKFRPSDQELITKFLLPRCMGEHVPFLDDMVDRVLYGDHANPWDVLRDVHWDIVSISRDLKTRIKTIKKVVYVFTSLTKTTQTGKRVSRTAGHGTWKGETAGKEIMSNEGQLIGLNTTFTYKCNDVRIDGSWIMHQYCLAGHFSDKINIGDLVLCKITRTYKEPMRNPTMSSMPSGSDDVYFSVDELVGDQQGPGPAA